MGWKVMGWLAHGDYSASAKPNCNRSSRTILDNSFWGWKFSYQVKAAHFWKPCNEEEEESGKDPEPLP